MTSWHALERADLVRSLSEAGPDAPTLCEGWRGRHLAAHVVLRERSLLVPVGGGRLAERSDQAIEDAAARAATADGFDALVAQIAEGPRRWHPLSWAAELANVLEFFVHTEDVRRGAGQIEPRALDPERVEALWGHLLRMAPLAYRRAGAGVVLVRPDGVRRAVRRPTGDQGAVVVRGEVGELVLHAFGRGARADVAVEGDPLSVEALQGAFPGGGATTGR
ncbi:TIGR03085 family metal-binding protein [Cellulomonas chengniuliangii]|uniref:TIGR03085 family metal-binding protein n=1 Tax=Cellulomonas chengniuliangii TaxID=2968084 RepID=A0ABY5L1B6_9CELL|nr:TIGR03085 family metal-binding protein [Cellulomonas chengniuliangii]MCC2308180.1 TIGR03085 family protein [Cellulomonas chengniuliangii]MCC2317187.1 TIGR03085 family protein [Cellulomonas chengniuliangii]UUI76572.1 TIGR03085 family metal-binding protein [Cellulomonas chengniuliangii]